jgi:predicted MFS family arabinose efflux permease
MIGFATALSTRAVDPIVPPIAQSLMVDPGTVALLSTAFALPFALVQPILGPIADMIGKVRLMTICLVVIIAASMVCALATSFPVLLAARIVCGMASGGIFPVGMALIGDSVSIGERQVAIARWLAIVIGGNVIGGAFAGAIADLFGWRAVFFVVGAVGVAAFANAMINLRQLNVRPERVDIRSIPSGYAAIFANPRAKFCFLAVYLEGVAMFGLFPFVALLLLATGEARASIAGAVIAAFSVGGVIYSLAARQITRLWQPPQMMIGGGVICGVALAIIGLDMAWPVQVVLFLVLGIGFYSLHSCIQVEATELSTTARGAAMSLHSSFFFLGHATGPVLYGLGFATIGAMWSVLAGGVLMLLTGLMCAKYLRRAPAT